MQQKKQKVSGYLAILWVLLAAVSAVGATFAWFSFHPSTNIEPMCGTISSGAVSLLISERAESDFAESCPLTPDSDPEELKPLSTANLERFFTASAQNSDGISILYREITESYGENGIHGTLYLKSENGGCDVYFYRSGMDFGADAQALAALRLGLKIRTAGGTSTYIFRLDAMGAVDTAQRVRTVPQSGTVVSDVQNGGTPVYVQDTALELDGYFAVEKDAADSFPTAGETRLATLLADETAAVEYWLYLEGCDDNCINAVQNRGFSLQLAFAGVAAD